MPIPAENLANSLAELKKLQDTGLTAIQSKQLTRVHREKLLKSGFLKQVMKGWYISSDPNEQTGETTSWYSSYWKFCTEYLKARFAENWCLSPEQSINLNIGDWTIPPQLLVRTPRGRNKPTRLLHGLSILDLKLDTPRKEHTTTIDGMRILKLHSALVFCSQNHFRSNPLNMRSAGYTISPSDPFTEKLPAFNVNLRIAESPHTNRIRLLWQEHRQHVKGILPQATTVHDKEQYLAKIEEVYATDAYHSLSIEGCRVSKELIERVRSGDWKPDIDDEDAEHKNALAARGYYQAFRLVKKSIQKILGGQNPGTVVDKDHSSWYRELFAPSVTAGIIEPAALAGYRNHPVYIRNSMHTPPPYEAVRTMMRTFFELLSEESDASARIMLGHFVFVFIHPYSDGNGRIGRFLMNAMNAADGFPWVVIPVERRKDYMNSLEEASVHRNILPFARFLAGLFPG